MTDGNAQYAHRDGRWLLVLSGVLRHTLGPALNALIDDAVARPETRQFIIDLTAADTIDSTCLGTLARIAVWSKETSDAESPVIYSTNEDVTETLETVCFDRLFTIRSSPLDEEWQELHDVAEQATAIDQMSDLILQAHERLSEIDESNREQFRGVIDAFRRDTGDRSKGGK